MVDKIILKNKTEAVIYFTHRAPLTVFSSIGQVMDMVDELLCPPNGAEVRTLSAYNLLANNVEENTQVIELHAE